MYSLGTSPSHLRKRCLDVSWGPAIWRGFNNANMTASRYDDMKYDVTLTDLRCSARNGCCWCSLLLENIIRNTQTSHQSLSFRIRLHFRAQPEGFIPRRIDLVSVNISGQNDEHLPEILLGVFTTSRKLCQDCLFTWF